MINVRDFGAIPDGVTDCSAAFDAALAASPGPDRDPYGNPLAAGSGVVHIPPGHYRTSRPIVLTRRVIFQGEGGGIYDVTRIVPDPGVVGIVVAGTPDWTVQPGDALGSVIRDLTVRSAGGGDLTTHGIDVRTRCKLERVGVWGFAGNGVHAVSGDVYPNLNLLRMDGCEVVWCQNGLYLKATNANAGVFTLCQFNNNRGWGVLDESFLGNTYVACHTDANGLGPYSADTPAAVSQFLNCYAEGGQNPSRFGQFVTLIGGNYGSGIEPGHYTHVLPGNLPGLGSGCQIHPNVIVRTGGPRPISSRFGGAAGTLPTVIEFTADEENGSTHLLTYNDGAGDYSGPGAGWWSLIAANSSGFTAFSIAGTAAKDSYGQSVGQADLLARCPVNSLRVPHLFVRCKDTPATPRVSFGTAPPTSPEVYSEWGDVLINTQPVAGGWNCWRCVETGRPGAWLGVGRVGGP